MYVLYIFWHIAEEGTHEELTEKRGIYYTLVCNQLEIGG